MLIQKEYIRITPLYLRISLSLDHEVKCVSCSCPFSVRFFGLDINLLSPTGAKTHHLLHEQGVEIGARNMSSVRK